MDELRAYFQLMVAERQRLASTVAREHRPLTDVEIAKLAELTQAIDGLKYTIQELSPPAADAAPAKRGPASDDYRLVASHTLEKFRDNYRLTNQLFADYGRWLITTIGALHFGGIYILATTTVPDVAQEWGIWTLTVGIVLILLAGLTTWWNWYAASQLFANWTDANMLVNPDAWPKDDALLSARMAWTFRASIILGVLSAFCAPLAVALSIGVPG